jgi:hypothetical protein
MPATTPNNNNPRTVLVVCNGGHRVSGVPSLVGQACWVCGVPWRLPDEVDEMIRRSVEVRG